MTITELLDKYKKILSPILECKPEEIKFFIKGLGITYKEQQIEHELKELNYLKDKNWSLGEYIVKVNNNTISSWVLYQMPHCCAFMISCNVVVSTQYRNKKIGTILNRLRQDIGKSLGYSAVICTDIEQNINQRKLLKTNGWKDVYSVINKRTDNKVYLSVIDI